MALTEKPTAHVTLHFTSNDTTEGTVGNPELTFTPDNWNAPQEVLVTGVDDDIADGSQTYAVTYSVTSEDSAYAELDPASVELQNKDNDSAGITVSAVSGPTTEAGGQATFTTLPDREMRARMVRYMESIPGFDKLHELPWYPGKRYPGVISRAQAELKART
ncbi:hypothetical protein JQX13_20655 [Archangium violaceum]|uniref:hypothetical protein n=1 Tax=Archangium violaceum TaxID=83451 RepID=UPI00193B684B|nr:hypothetical protein [Archangium violaceum]QRK12234.1 hypothetical protein JQX13_20655 [Archangium violaceum]